MNIHSKITGELLHIIQRAKEVPGGRVDVVPPTEFLQMATINLVQNQTFRAHKHLYQPRKVAVSQESWVVISGLIEAILYDLDDSELQRVELGPGDCSITLTGGHNYIAKEPSLVYEYKTGPYYSQELDKTFI